MQQKCVSKMEEWIDQVRLGRRTVELTRCTTSLRNKNIREDREKGEEVGKGKSE